MIFFFKPGGYSEPEESSLNRQFETSRVFPGTLLTDRRLYYVKDPAVFLSYSENWISEEFLSAVGAFDVVRTMLRNLYRETFPDGLSKLSATADRHNTREVQRRTYMDLSRIRF
jgi:hypothetical protein